MTRAFSEEETSALFDQALGINHDGLEALQAAAKADPLKSSLVKAARLIGDLEGRLVVTGLGKSGHIGRKLAATFASTGTPSYFVHGSEASHGDLGVIQPKDAVLMLTWSGATHELSDLVAYTRRFDVPLIAITGNGNAKLARAADICLALPKVRESCPHNLAPTTSALLQMAVGDALAVTLLQLKGFSESSFHRFHPGGKLGAALTAIDDVMLTGDELPLVEETTPIEGVVGMLSAKSLGIVGVCDAQGLLSGVITDGDIRRYLGQSADMSMRAAMYETYAGSIMTEHPVTLSPGILSAKALNTLQTSRISAAFVLDDGRPVGAVTTLMLLQAGAG